MGNLWTTRVSGDGIAALGWQPRAWRRAGLMIISCGSCGFGRKKGIPPTRSPVLCDRIVDCGSLSHYWCPHMWRPESGE